MEEVFSRGWQDFLARTEGPMNLRFVIQPLVASFLAIRAGLRDAQAGRPAFFWSLLSQRDSRRRRIEEMSKDIGKVLVVALSLDFIYQLIVLHGVYLLELLFTGTILAILPYVLIRGPVNRIARRLNPLKRGGQNESV